MAQHDLALRAGCVAGASLLDDLAGMLHDAGFVDIRIQPKDESKTFIREWVPGTNIADYLISATIEAISPMERPSMGERSGNVRSDRRPFGRPKRCSTCGQLTGSLWM